MIKNGNGFRTEMSEFKGGTNAKLDMIFIEIKELRGDVDSLKSWKSYVVGITIALTVALNLFKDWFIQTFKQT